MNFLELNGIAPIVAFIEQYKYLALFIGTILEGPMLMVGSGFLISTHSLQLTPTYLVLLAGDLVGDVIWYWVGFFGGRWFIERYGRFFSVTPALFSRVESLFSRHDTKILFLSKITMGLGAAIATLVAAGASRVPFGKYVLINTLGGIIWTAFLLTIGYYFGGFYSRIENIFQAISLIGGLAILLLVLFGVVKYIGRKFLKTL